MSHVCAELHRLVNALPTQAFPFDSSRIARNGFYVLFEDGEQAHGGRRIVRIGTHTGAHQLGSRLVQHFVMEKKDRSIFRKNIGRALLNQTGDPFLADWNLDLTTRAARVLHGARIDTARQLQIEEEVSSYMRRQFRFAVIPAGDKTDRLWWESRLISTVAQCEECKPSRGWLGLSSPSPKIRDSGLWQVNELSGSTLTDSSPADFSALFSRK